MYIENNKQRPPEEGFYGVTYSNGNIGIAYWNLHNWEGHSPVTHWGSSKPVDPEIAKILEEEFDNLI